MRLLGTATALCLVFGAACSAETPADRSDVPSSAPALLAVPTSTAALDDEVAGAPAAPVIDINSYLTNGPSIRPDTHELTYVDVTGENRTIVIEVRQPMSNRTTSPVLVWSHGGSTGKKSPVRVGARWSAALNQGDFAFVAIAHPGRSAASRQVLCEALVVESCGEFKYLLWDRLSDARTVFDWLERAAEAGELFVDLDRLVYGGHSAGALAVMVMAGMDSPYTTGVPMPIDDRPAAFLVASPPGVDTNGIDASMVTDFDRPTLLITGDSDTTGGTTGADRLALFDLIDSEEVMLISTDSDLVGHTTFDLNQQPCTRAGGSPAHCRETVKALAKTAELFLRAALGTAGLDAELLVSELTPRLPDHMQLASAST